MDEAQEFNNEWARYQINFPADDEMEDEIDRKIRKIEESKKLHVTRGIGIRGT